jgi:glycosyltransferase involved in cell wall biosynthesis
MHVAWPIKRVKMNSEKSLGIVLPALNEENNLEGVVLELISVLNKTNWDYQLIIINDGSSDMTGSIADKLSKFNHVEVLHNKNPKNIGSCYKAGARILKTKYITWLPTDGEIDPEVIHKMLDTIKPGRVTIPYPKDGRESRSFHRRWLSMLYQFGINKAFRLNLKYFNGNSVVPREFFETHRFLSSGFTINVEIILYALIKRQMGYAEVPFTLRKRKGDQEKALKLSNVLNVLKSLLDLYKRYHV